MNVLPKALFPQQLNGINICNYAPQLLMQRSKVILEQNVISFLLEGHKEVSYSGGTTKIDAQKVLLMTQGNCLTTEQAFDKVHYRCILLFYSQQKLKDFFVKYSLSSPTTQSLQTLSPYFVVEKDDFIYTFIHSLEVLMKLQPSLSPQMLEAKFEEIMLYLLGKFGSVLSDFLQYSILQGYELSFRSTVETNKYGAMTLEEIAFLCNMSISTFKRHFEKIYGQTPGKWFKVQKLSRAKELLQLGGVTPSELHKTMGYKNLSNFSTAFKNEFGVSPSQIIK